MGNIIIPGFPAGMLVPGIYLNVELGRQPPSAGGEIRRVLLIGLNEDAGTAEAGKLYRVSRLNGTSDPNSAESLFGKETADPTSRLYWMAKAAFTANPFLSLYAIRVDGAAIPPVSYANVLASEDGPAANQRFHYIVVDEPAPVSLLKDYLEALAHPLVGFRQQGVVASGVNADPSIPIVVRSPRLQFVLSPQNEGGAFTPDEHYPGFMLAAAVAALRSEQESIDPGVNLSLEKVRGVPLPYQDKEYTKTQLNAQLSAGYTPLVPAGSDMLILRSVTTAASVEENIYPVLDTGKVTVTDYVADDIEKKMVNRYTGFKLAPDTDLPAPSRTATPSGIKSSLLEWLHGLEKAGLIVLVDELAARVKVELDDTQPGRVNFEIPEDVIDIFAVGAGNIIQLG